MRGLSFVARDGRMLQHGASRSRSQNDTKGLALTLPLLKYAIVSENRMMRFDELRRRTC